MKSFRKFLEDIPVAPVTGWRWRKKGFISTITIAGRLYVTDEAVIEFNRRAAAGEFSMPAMQRVKGGGA